ncbi:CTP synthase [Candidatus Uhrbacteria bacterium RIFCSPHIGHO2_02_FULL_53_13]|uniref:CTP synthase n=2 Tax=Candidatus Uhriibacteriota TaxID=1752732 RepID=A0A1F7TYC4_9BACT|nr:MAG: CTP synthase [Candidatus Uhrbacteria bacterium RIFCSPHIGHO2_02_FULL_53_13]OGL90393.1 MAG: CTP synthase [Candidatus Uhrbacteria bacterium RIFCSPLOWO2_02_FULL_53_10]
MQTRYVFVIGGVMSGVGKGATTAAIGRVLQSKGFTVTAVKIDPYVNVDAGTMNPVEHGEVFVTVDGDETDQDMGNYERFLGVDMTRDNYMTTGRVYQSVIERERNLEYGGRCVEVVPHVPEEVIRRIERAGTLSKADFVLVEVGGTVGEYQNVLFLEALRLLKLRDENAVRTILVSYLPVPPSIGEMKTKPTQHAVREVNHAGIRPDFIVCRSRDPIDGPRREKIATFCGVAREHIIAAPNVKTIYAIPQLFEEQGFGDAILKSFGMKPKASKLKDWYALTDTITSATEPVKIGVIGKYFETGAFVLSDVYLSVLEAIKHAAWANGRIPEIEWINSEDYEREPKKLEELRSLQGIIIPGGFGTRGIEGKISAIRFSREHEIPYFGLCYGMQCAVIEYARNILGWADANTEEMNPNTHHLMIHFMEGQRENTERGRYGGTLRLGAWPCALKHGSIAAEAYGAKTVNERHRHRYEFNNVYRENLECAGLMVSGESPDGELVEIVEIPDHPFFVGVQFHPEFQSRPLAPHPLFVQFIQAATQRA